MYQLQRKVKALRESVDRKDLHLDMLRRKFALNEEAAKASKLLEDERDDLLARYTADQIWCGLLIFYTKYKYLIVVTVH